MSRTNREQLLCAALEVFGEQGLDASIADVAPRADVGIGTLHRHFPDRDALVTAVFEARRRSAHALLVELIGRAQEAGRLRPDFVAEDVALLLMANAGVVAATAHTIPDAWRRPVNYLLQAFDARNTDPLPPAPTPDRMVRAMARTRRGSRSR